MDNLAEKFEPDQTASFDLKLVAEQLSVGALLKKGREDSKLTQRQVAQRLNMSETHILYLETEAFDALPNQAFVRGYLRNIAQCVGVNSEDVLAAYQRYVEANSEPPKVRKRERLKAATSDPLMRLMGILSVVAFVATSIYFWQQQQSLPISESSSTEQVTVVEVETVDGETLIEAVDLSAKPSPVEIQQQASLSIQFVDSSWLEVRNAEEDILFNGVKLADETLELTSSGFFDVAIGNAAAVKLSYNGSPVDLSNATRTGDISNIQLGLRQP